MLTCPSVGPPIGQREKLLQLRALLLPTLLSRCLGHAAVAGPVKVIRDELHPGDEEAGLD